jgi:hypothetical protein
LMWFCFLATVPIQVCVFLIVASDNLEDPNFKISKAML